MARYASGEHIQEISKLIQTITPFKPGQVNHKRCLEYTLSMFFNHTYPDTYKAQVQHDVDALVEKFTINSEHERARSLKSVFEKFMVLAESMDTEDKQNMMKIARYLILMNSHSYIRDKSGASYEEVEEKMPEAFDWLTYLNEGIEIDPDIGRGSSDESEWSDLSEVEELNTRSEIITSQIVTEEDTENSSDIMTSVEVSFNPPSPLKDGVPLEVINDMWKAGKPGYKCPEIEVDNRFPAPKLAQICCGSSPVRILSEYAVIREIIFALRDNSACGLVFKKEANHKYSVLNDVTICSLSPEMFRNVLGSVAPTLSVLSQMHSFVDGMLPNSLENEFQFPPKSYQAYAASLQLVFEKQNAFLLHLETKVKAQDEIMTLVSVLDHLRPWFKFLHEIYRIHKRAIFEKYNVQQYWICSSKLLSVLWNEAEQAASHELAAMVFSMLLISLKPFLDITESWFKCGSLDDPLEEYLISGEISEAENTLDGDYILHPYEQSLIDLGVNPLPALKVIATKGLTVGRSICLLRGLDCMDQVPKSLDHTSLYDELISRLRSQLLPSNVEEDVLACPSLELKEVPAPDELHLPDSLEQYTLDFILSTCDANQLEAYGDVLQLGLDVDHHTENFTYGGFEFPFKSSEICTVQSLNHIMCEILLQILDSRVHNLGKLAQRLLQDKCKISNHLGAMQKVAFFDIFTMQEFCSFLIEEVAKDENWPSWANWVLLTNRLQVCLSEQHLDWSHLFSVHIDENYVADPISEITEGFPLMQLVNRLSVKYRMEWPTNLVLTSKNMKMYNDVFRFVLKIKCALSNLQRLCLNEMHVVMSGKDESSHRLWILRSWILFLLRTIQEHILSHILLDLKQHLNEKLLNAIDFHSALEAHDRFVKRAHYSCLLSKGHFSAQEHIMEVVSQAMVICDAFNNGKIDLDVIENMEMKLNLAFNFLTIFFDSIMRSGNSVHLLGISVALNDKAPNF